MTVDQLTSCRTRLGDALACAADALAEAGTVDLDGVGGVELNDALVGLQRLRGRLDAVEARLLGRWDADKVWQDDGAKSGAAWLAWKQHLPIGEARRRLRHARALRTLPEVAQAWADGDIDRSHLATLLGVRTTRTADAFDRDHPHLLDSARRETFSEFRRRCQRWEAIVDPDGAEQGAEEARAAREVHLAETLGGMWYGTMTLDPISGTIVHTTLELIEQQLFEQDWADAKARLGRQPLVGELDRTPAQRRADALVEMATRARTAPADGRRPAPLFTVVVGYETFAGPVLELFNRTVITPGTTATHLDGADIERIVFDSPSRVIDVGAQRRFYRGAQRRAIEVRDRVCYHRTCDESPSRPQIDHIWEAGQGGPTTQTNGRLACGFHNRLRNTRPDVTGDTHHERASPTPDDPHAGPDPPDP